MKEKRISKFSFLVAMFSAMLLCFGMAMVLTNPIQLKDAQAVHAEGEATLDRTKWLNFKNTPIVCYEDWDTGHNNPIDSTYGEQAESLVVVHGTYQEGDVDVGTNVYARYEDEDEDGYGEITIFSTNDSKVFLPVNSSFLFDGLGYLEEIDLLEMDATNVKFMHQLFNYSLENFSGLLDLSTWHTPNLLTISYAFEGLSYSDENTMLDISNFDLSGVCGIDGRWGFLTDNDSAYENAVKNEWYESLTESEQENCQSWNFYNDWWFWGMDLYDLDCLFLPMDGPHEEDQEDWTGGSEQVNFSIPTVLYVADGDDIDLMSDDYGNQIFIASAYYSTPTTKSVVYNSSRFTEEEFEEFLSENNISLTKVVEPNEPTGPGTVASTGVEVAVLPMVLTVVLGGVLLVTLKKKEQR